MNFDENAVPTLTVGFNFDAVDNVEHEFETALDMASEAMRKLALWVYQPPCQDMDGFIIRSIIVSWIFVPALREYSMTDISKKFGKKKQ